MTSYKYLQVASQGAQEQMESLLRWLDDSEDLFANLRPVSVDRQQLSEQAQAHRVVNADIDNQRAQVDAMCEAAESKPQLREHVEDMLDRYDNLVTQAQRRGDEIEEVQPPPPQPPSSLPPPDSS